MQMTHGSQSRTVRGPAARFLAVGLGVVLAPTALPHAQEAPLVNAAGEVREEAYDHLRRALTGADRVYERIDGRRLKGWLNDVVAFSRRSRDDGNRYWGRISGTPYERMTADWTEERFRELGMESIHQVEFELGPQWFPTDWTLRAESGDERLSFGSANPATRSDSIPEPITAEAVWVGLGTEADFAGRDVAGKAVIVQTILAPGQMGNSASWEGATKRAEEGGAALIVGIWGYAGNMAIWQSLSSFQMIRKPGRDGALHAAQVATPGFFMGFEDGPPAAGHGRDWRAGAHHRRPRHRDPRRAEQPERLRHPARHHRRDDPRDGPHGRLLRRRPRQRLRHGGDDRPRRLLRRDPAEERRRSITFIGTAGHHVGSPNAPYLRDQGMLENTALMVNCEHVAPTQFVAFNNELRLTTTVSPRRWWVHGSQALLDIALDAYDTFGVTVIGAMDGRATGEMMAIDKEAPSVQLIRSPEHKHTDWDIPELVPAAGIEAVARAFARIIDQANTLDIEELRQ